MTRIPPALILMIANLAPVRAQTPPAPAACYKLYRLVEQKDASDAQAPYKKWNDQTSYVSASNIASIEGIVTPWSWRKQAEIFWMYDLSLNGTDLKSTLAKETNTFPLGNNWERLWEMPQAFSLDSPVVFNSRIAERDYKVTMTWAREAEVSKCALPKAIRPDHKNFWKSLLEDLGDDDIAVRDDASAEFKRFALASEEDPVLRSELKTWLTASLAGAKELEVVGRLKEALAHLSPAYRFRFKLAGEARVKQEVKIEVFVKNISAETQRFWHMMNIRAYEYSMLERGFNYRWHHVLPFQPEFDPASTPPAEIIALEPGQEVELFSARPGLDWANKITFLTAGKHPVTFSYRRSPEPWTEGNQFEWAESGWRDELGPIAPGMSLPKIKPAPELIVDVKE